MPSVAHPFTVLPPPVSAARTGPDAAATVVHVDHDKPTGSPLMSVARRHRAETIHTGSNRHEPAASDVPSAAEQRASAILAVGVSS